MKKADIRQIFIKNLEEIRGLRGLTKQQLAERAGMSGGHLSEVINGLSDITLRRLADLAGALGVQPWELLADSDSTRRAALAQMLWGGNVTNEKVEQHFPPAPQKEEAPRPKKSLGRSSGGRSLPPLTE